MISQSLVDFSSRNPNLESLTFEQILSFLDESWSTLDQMMNVTSKWGCWPKIRSFDCMLTTVDFLTNTIDFHPSEQLSEATWLVKLETWHGESLKHMMRHNYHWRCWKPPWSENSQTLVWVNCLGEGLSGQPLWNPWVWICEMSWEVGGKILGYDSCPCSIFFY